MASTDITDCAVVNDVVRKKRQSSSLGTIGCYSSGRLIELQPDGTRLVRIARQPARGAARKGFPLGQDEHWMTKISCFSSQGLPSMKSMNAAFHVPGGS
jgi:hypothetical protein